MAALIRSYEIDYERVLLALKLTFLRRKTHRLPEELKAPPKEWRSAFETLARQCNTLEDMEAAFFTVCHFYEKVMLANTR